MFYVAFPNAPLYLACSRSLDRYLTALPAMSLALNAPLYLACSRSLDRYLTVRRLPDRSPQSLHSLIRDVFYVSEPTANTGVDLIHRKRLTIDQR